MSNKHAQCSIWRSTISMRLRSSMTRSQTKLYTILTSITSIQLFSIPRTQRGWIRRESESWQLIDKRQQRVKVGSLQSQRKARLVKREIALTCCLMQVLDIVSIAVSAKTWRSEFVTGIQTLYPSTSQSRCVSSINETLFLNNSGQSLTFTSQSTMGSTHKTRASKGEMTSSSTSNLVLDMVRQYSCTSSHWSNSRSQRKEKSSMTWDVALESHWLLLRLRFLS